MAAKEKPNLIIMDIQLPGIDGLETTRRIRESKTVGQIPIVALTSHALTGEKEKAIKAGCTGYLEKPLNPETFMTNLEKYF